MKLDTLHKTQLGEGAAAELGHVGLDLAGLVPGVGEAADLANALWYIKEERWISAAFSLISIVPAAGDLVGKGMKYLGKGSGIFGKFMLKHGDEIAKYWTKAKILIKRADKLRNKIGDDNLEKMDAALTKLMRDAKKKGKKDSDEDEARRDLIRDIKHRN